MAKRKKAVDSFDVEAWRADFNAPVTPTSNQDRTDWINRESANPEQDVYQAQYSDARDQFIGTANNAGALRTNLSALSGESNTRGDGLGDRLFKEYAPESANQFMDNHPVLSALTGPGIVRGALNFGERLVTDPGGAIQDAGNTAVQAVYNRQSPTVWEGIKNSDIGAGIRGIEANNELKIGGALRGLADSIVSESPIYEDTDLLGAKTWLNEQADLYTKTGSERMKGVSKIEGGTEFNKVLRSTIPSVYDSMVGVGLSAVNPIAGASYMGVGQGLVTYATDRHQGIDVDSARANAGTQALAETLFEYVPLAKMASVFKGTSKIIPGLIRSTAAEVGTELPTTYVQNVSQRFWTGTDGTTDSKGNLNKKDWREYAKGNELDAHGNNVLWRDLVETTKQTMMQSLIMAGAAGAGKQMRRLSDTETIGEKNQWSDTMYEQWGQFVANTVAAQKLREAGRDPGPVQVPEWAAGPKYVNTVMAVLGQHGIAAQQDQNGNPLWEVNTDSEKGTTSLERVADMLRQITGVGQNTDVDLTQPGQSAEEQAQADAEASLYGGQTSAPAPQGIGGLISERRDARGSSTQPANMGIEGATVNPDPGGYQALGQGTQDSTIPTGQTEEGWSEPNPQGQGPKPITVSPTQTVIDPNATTQADVDQGRSRLLGALNNLQGPKRDAALANAENRGQLGDEIVGADAQAEQDRQRMAIMAGVEEHQKAVEAAPEPAGRLQIDKGNGMGSITIQTTPNEDGTYQVTFTDLGKKDGRVTTTKSHPKTMNRLEIQKAIAEINSQYSVFGTEMSPGGEKVGSREGTSSQPVAVVGNPMEAFKARAANLQQQLDTGAVSVDGFAKEMKALNAALREHIAHNELLRKQEEANKPAPAKEIETGEPKANPDAKIETPPAKEEAKPAEAPKTESQPKEEKPAKPEKKKLPEPTVDQPGLDGNEFAPMVITPSGKVAYVKGATLQEQIVAKQNEIDMIQQLLACVGK